MPNKINFLIFIIYFVSLILYQIEAHTALGDMPAPKEHPCYHKNEFGFVNQCTNDKLKAIFSCCTGKYITDGELCKCVEVLIK
uniref:Uncharacterized protein n=1 Tax=Meloidogyne incognita TaxID=6306 RepID=A0A914MVU3_MELIC